MPNNTHGWGAFLPRYNIPETFGTAIAYEAQLHWFLENWNEVADYANALEQPTLTLGSVTYPDDNSAELSVTNVGTDTAMVLDIVWPDVHMRIADPYQWDVTSAYDPLMIVENSQGFVYISRQAVPAGTALTNTDYWEPMNLVANIDTLITQTTAAKVAAEDAAEAAEQAAALVTAPELHVIASGTNGVVLGIRGDV